MRRGSTSETSSCRLARACWSMPRTNRTRSRSGMCARSSTKHTPCTATHGSEASREKIQSRQRTWPQKPDKSPRAGHHQRHHRHHTSINSHDKTLMEG
eukprot:COSAG01_NODE_4548_length_4932_cov_3.672460_4_plen_98_part_00